MFNFSNKYRATLINKCSSFISIIFYLTLDFLLNKLANGLTNVS